MRIIGSLIILFSALAIARALTLEIERTLRQVSAFRGVLEQAKRQIDCYAMSASEILRRIDPSILSDCGYSGATPPRDFFELIESVRIRDAECESTLFSFAKDFGKAYRADEIAFCTLYIERMRSREQKLLKELSKRKRIIYTVAVCSALGAVILLI